ncbi:MAG TPA: nicotinate-nucleotide--dimethylbenzimidazole phosphoribosyltransferase [Holophaga sp.]|jgi:nicotinate-nucleotide--dimethylbenzimidazole phosphoribosyltransferase|nr:nicotinate-nucleotide--dimethylbenzimidazole phosphoribosyltransferase [Holophaga sp.]
MKLPVLPTLDPALKPRIQAHLDDLTKPQGSLGRLEPLALQLAWIAGDLRPVDPEAHILTFGGDHGIVRHGVSAFPQEVTPQMVANMAMGGAAICVFSRANRIQHRVIDVGVASPCPFANVSQRNVVRGTGDPLEGPAMTRDQAEATIQAGIDEVEDLPLAPFALLGLGEMGIGNSAIAALLVSAFGGIPPEASVGPGTGVRGEALEHKLAVIRQVLSKHAVDASDPIGVLSAFGGAEFGAMAGAMLAAASRGWAVIVDGYISGAAALLALALDPGLKDFLFWSHCSAEPGARRLLDTLGIEPVLDLGFRLGEGTGAALSVPILRSACAMLREMATFSGAGVSKG